MSKQLQKITKNNYKKDLQATIENSLNKIRNIFNIYAEI